MYLVGDTNGAFIGNNGLTDNKDEAKVFKNIGDAMRACVQEKVYKKKRSILYIYVTVGTVYKKRK